MYKVSRVTHNGWRQASIIPVELIRASVHLFPQFGQQTRDWNMFTVLELCQLFYINSFSNRDVYLMFLK
jgi:hypothetical protein